MSSLKNHLNYFLAATFSLFTTLGCAQYIDDLDDLEGIDDIDITSSALTLGGWGGSAATISVSELAMFDPPPKTLSPEPSKFTEDPCPDWRWVGVTDGDECPKPTDTSWSTLQLFDINSGDDVSIYKDDVPTTGLSQYCVYENTGANFDTGDILALLDLPQGPRLASVSKDCMVISAQSPALNSFVTLKESAKLRPDKPPVDLRDVTFEDMRDNFYTQVGKPNALPSDFLNFAFPARLVVIDSAPTVPPDRYLRPARTPGPSKHGYTIANMAADFLCEEQIGFAYYLNPIKTWRCMANIATGNALAYNNYRSDENLDQRDRNSEGEGGHVGSIGDLAKAITRAVRDWENFSKSEEPNLVLNLSVGFLKTWTHLSSGKMRDSVAALHDAIQYANCSGALLIASAGNRFFADTSHTGPVLPAAWETEAAPSRSECVEILDGAECENCREYQECRDRLDDPVRSGNMTVEERTYCKNIYKSSRKTCEPVVESAVCKNLEPSNFPVAAKIPPYRPLVHSVGGNTNSGGKIPNGANKGFPRLGAFSDHAVVEGRFDKKPTLTFTGTSVGAIVVSSAAAAAWRYLPHLNSWQIMQLVYESSDPLPYNADYYLGGTECQVARRVSLCKTMLRAYTEAFRRMSATPDPTNLKRLEDCAGRAYPSRATAKKALDSDFEDTAIERNFLNDNDGIRRIDTPLQDTHNDAMTKPWVWPLPTVVGCPACFASLSHETLYIHPVPVDEAPYAPEGEIPATLSLNGVHFSLPLPESVYTNGVFVNNIPVEGLYGGGEAVISIPISDEITTTTPLAIVQ